jgi:hypothetical protein
MKIEDRLQQMLANGAVYQETGLIHPLAFARITPDGRLFYVLMFDASSHWEHSLQFGFAEDDGYYINFKEHRGELLAMIAPVESDEEVQAWQAWQEYIKTPAGKAVLESIERAYQVHLNWNQ